MKRIVPAEVYQGLPCSAVAVGCAMGRTDNANGLISKDLHDDGYLSLYGMNKLIRANLSVLRQEKIKREYRPVLRDWAHRNLGKKAIICVSGHYIYFDGRDYHSFFWNGGDPVICVWYLA